MRVPVYEQQVRLRPEKQTGLNVRATPNAFGAQIGDAMQDLAGGVYKVAGAIDAKQALTAEADAREALNGYLQERRDILRDPTSGALNQTGANGMEENRKTATERLREARARAEEGLNPRARNTFSRNADELDNTSADQLIVHSSGQTRSYITTSMKTTAENLLQEAQDNYTNEAEWQRFTAAALQEEARLAALEGLPPAAIEQRQRDILETAHGNRAIRIAYDDPVKADEYLDAHREELGESRYGELKNGMEQAVVEHKATQFVDRLAGGDGYVGPQGDLDSLGRERYIVGAESSHNPRARNRKPGQSPDEGSTAYGSAQFLDGTYLEWVGKVTASGGAQWALGLTRAEILETRSDPTKEAEIYRAFRDNNLRVMASRGIQDTPRNRYAMHHFGTGGGPALLSADPYRSVEDVLGPGVIKANPYMRGKTVGQVLAILERKVKQNGAGGGMSPREAYEKAMAIEDPKVRQRALEVLDARFKTEDAVNAREERDANDEAWRLFTEEGMNPNKLPPELQIRMGREGVLNFYQSARAYAAGADITDEVRLSELRRMAVEDRQGFADLDLSFDRANLSQADYRMVETMWLEARDAANKKKTGTYTDDGMKTVWTEADGRYRDHTGVNPGGSMTPEQAARYNRYRDGVETHAQTFFATNKAEMDWSQRERMFSMLLAPVTINPPGWNDQIDEGFLFEAPFVEGEVTGRLGRGDVKNAEWQASADELRSFFGREPSEDEVLEHHNRRVLASYGVSPDMEYTDIPGDVRRKMWRTYPDMTDSEMVDLYIEFLLERAGGQ